MRMSISKTISGLKEKFTEFIKQHMRSLISCAVFVLMTTLLIVIYIISRQYPHFVYKYYTTGVFKIITFIPKAIARIWPFSFAEFFFVLFLIFFFTYTIIVIGKTIKALILRRYRPLHRFARYCTFILKTICVLLSTFILFGGFNYNSLPLSEVAGYEIKATDTELLAALCRLLEDKAAENYIDATEVPLFDLLDEAENAYANARENYEFLNNYTDFLSPPKPAVLSTGMCYLQLSGIYPIVYTESIVNYKAPRATLPHTICHELAHQMGFAREDEANYIAFIACVSSNRKEFVYSGYYAAFVYSMNALYQYDNDRWLAVYEQTDPRIIDHMRQANEFWDSYTTPNDILGNISESVNDAYLNSNNVSDGVHSYGRIVDLLIAELLQDYS
ncbi:MAG: DUF3810 domain-containing protein [Ruminococcaceae bacterium]|nr:DUF3810 domain-containing protein [Oscillospiraceae bacterium]